MNTAKKILEKSIEKNILEYLEARGDGYFWKNNSVGVYDPVKRVYRKARSRFLIKGTADILGCYRGLFIALEVKTKSGRLTSGQKKFLQNINKQGGIGAVVRSMADTAIIMDAIKTGDIESASFFIVR